MFLLFNLLSVNSKFYLNHEIVTDVSDSQLHINMKFDNIVTRHICNVSEE